MENNGGTLIMTFSYNFSSKTKLLIVIFNKFIYFIPTNNMKWKDYYIDVI